jgi:SAM-dependent methyltransferase
MVCSQHHNLLFVFGSFGICFGLHPTISDAHTGSNTMTSRLKLLANSWSSAAIGYNNALVPRFAPWTRDVLQSLNQELPNLKISSNQPCCCVPCCGPGQELLPLSELLGPEWYVLGVDLAPGMIQVAQERIAKAQPSSTGTVDAVVSDCSSSLPRPSRSNKTHLELIVSIFGFQQMSDPIAVLQVWLEALSPDHGLLFVCFWPSSVEQFDDDNETTTPRPFAKWSEVVSERLNNVPRNNNTKDADVLAWDDLVVQKAQELGATIVRDEFISHIMKWEDADEFWNGMTRSGPWHAMRLNRGDDFVDSLKDEVCAAFGDGPFVHQARARLLVVRRGPQPNPASSQ